MKTKISIIISTFILIFMFACETTPPVPAPETELASAQKLKKRIDAFGFKEYDEAAYATAEENLQKGEAEYTKNNAASKEALDISVESYRTVLRKGIEARRKHNEGEIDPIIVKADTIKANVAVADKYTAAQESYIKAKQFAEEENWEEADVMYTQARNQYQAALSEAESKMNKADSAMKASDAAKEDLEKSVNESDEPAIEAAPAQ
ncbi:MAG: hypothetical protein JW904_01530 [Spirochaetales bacterium]|nr:hypothetical protein [Spirochaetales bacterium]